MRIPGPKTTTIVLQSPTAYTPKAPAGRGHRRLPLHPAQPAPQKNAFITSIDFQPNSPEVHHEITYAVPPDLAAAAEAQNDGGKGWTCFGESGLSRAGAGGHWMVAPLGSRPGGRATTSRRNRPEPAHRMPAGSLVIMQEHYNMLVGDKPVHSKLTLDYRAGQHAAAPPASGHLAPRRRTSRARPGVTGPMCSRAAELASVGQRFGMGQELLVDGLEVALRQESVRPARRGYHDVHVADAQRRATSLSWRRTCTCSGWA